MRNWKITILLLLLFLLLSLSGCRLLSAQQPTDCCSKLERICSKYEGRPYIWGGEFKDQKGGDCSGYVWKVFRDIGKNIPRTTARKYWIYFSEKEAIENWRNVSCGDIIWWTFSHDRPKGHIGIGVSHPKFWQSGSSSGVCSSKFFEGSCWTKNFDGAKEVFH